MISAKVEGQKQIILQMSEDEARWLMAYTQNQLAEAESTRDTRQRSEFFNTLKRALS